ncbi:protein UL9d [Cynomolgus macaque cytomegalovirus strain Mauritius]|uniref:Protein UL9d n=2 Tax=Cytomegalovirus TaxID=10358 RepID=A0A0K1GZX2_9BETA|nr:protein UL9d [Cynomolgus macaque cytomegalovirus strain Mauritius]
MHFGHILWKALFVLIPLIYVNMAAECKSTEHHRELEDDCVKFTVPQPDPGLSHYWYRPNCTTRDMLCYKTPSGEVELKAQNRDIPYICLENSTELLWCNAWQNHSGIYCHSVFTPSNDGINRVDTCFNLTITPKTTTTKKTTTKKTTTTTTLASKLKTRSTPVIKKPHIDGTPPPSHNKPSLQKPPLKTQVHTTLTTLLQSYPSLTTTPGYEVVQHTPEKQVQNVTHLATIVVLIVVFVGIVTLFIFKIPQKLWRKHKAKTHAPFLERDYDY